MLSAVQLQGKPKALADTAVSRKQGRYCLSKYPSLNVVDRSVFSQSHLFGLVLFLHGGAKYHVVVADSVHGRVSIRCFQGVLGVQAWAQADIRWRMRPAVRFLRLPHAEVGCSAAILH